MEVQARRRGRRTYYYLVHSYRDRGRVRKVEWYLGAALPHDLPQIKSARRIELLTQERKPELDKVGLEYRANLRKMPSIIHAKELDSFAVRFTYDTNRIEGSSLTFRETASLLLYGLTPSNRPASDVQESLAHRRVFLEALSQDEDLDRETFLAWHRKLFAETKPRIAGQIRRYRVGITGSRFQPPLPFELDILLDEFYRWYRAAQNTLHPVVLAGLVHFRLVSIHPFGDGNGRVTRFAMNFVLYQRRFPMFDIPYVARAGYYTALERAHLLRDEGIFLRWFLRRYLKENSRPAGRRPRPIRRP